MRERMIIDDILTQFKRDGEQLNKPFESDAEIVKVGNQYIAVTIDEFSDEDMFGDLGAVELGVNMATAVLSDLYACGSKPKYYVHAIVVPYEVEDRFGIELSKGVGSVLNQAGCYLIGGDLGYGDKWRYAATAIGELEGKEYISRKMPESEQSMWVTGELGAANLAALLGHSAPLFDLRDVEAKYIRDNALSCIDTSGGFIDSLWTLAEVNPSLCFEIETESLPVDSDVILFCKENKLPEQAFLFGGAGEYELLFTLPNGITPAIKAKRIGRIKPSSEKGIYFCQGQNRTRLCSAPPCARETKDRGEYVNLILEQVNNVFG